MKLFQFRVNLAPDRVEDARELVDRLHAAVRRGHASPPVDWSFTLATRADDGLR